MNIFFFCFIFAILYGVYILFRNDLTCAYRISILEFAASFIGNDTDKCAAIHDWFDTLPSYGHFLFHPWTFDSLVTGEFAAEFKAWRKSR